MAIFSFLDPVFNPLLSLPPFWSIIIVSFVLSLIMVVAYKYLTNQSLMKDLKDEIKELQKEMRTLRDNPKRMAEVQKQSMQTNFKYMRHSLRPSLVTLIPIMIIFAWLQGHLAYYPLTQGDDFSSLLSFDKDTEGIVTINVPEGIELLTESSEQQILNDEAKFVMKGEPGSYQVIYEYDQEEYSHEVIIVEDDKTREYAQVDVSIKDSRLNSITLSNKKIKPFENVPILNLIPWVKNWGWLGAYILFSLLFSIGMRKALKIY